jgi:hypothetical protein
MLTVKMLKDVLMQCPDDAVLVMPGKPWEPMQPYSTAHVVNRQLHLAGHTDARAVVLLTLIGNGETDAQTREPTRADEVSG